MARLLEDPTTEVCPDYESDEWGTVRQDIIDVHPGPEPLTNEVAAARLRSTWTALYNRRVAQWNQQRLEDQVAEDARRVEEDRRREEREREADDRRREQEKRKPKINSFDPNRRVGDWIAPRPSAFALNKLHQIEYIELDYFTPRGCKQAYLDQETTANNDTFSITKVDNIVALQPISSLKPSKSIRRDEELSWDEIVSAKNTMLYFISQSNVWPEGHVRALAAFYVLLETHPMRQRDFGNKIVATYASRVRREWFDALKRDEGFSLTLLNEDLMRSIADEVKDNARKEELREVSRYVIVTKIAC